VRSARARRSARYWWWRVMMLVDLDDGSKDSLFGVIVKVLAESDLASAVALKRCGSRLKDLATPLVANAVKRTNEKWRDAAAKIGGRGGAAITYGLERNEVLTNLNLSSNNIDGETGYIMASGELLLVDMTSVLAKPITDALKVDPVLKTLNLSCNNIGDEGAKVLASALRVNAVLTEVNLSDNNLGGETDYIKASEVEGESKEVGDKVIYEGREMIVSKGVDSDGDLKLIDAVQSGALAIAKALEVNEVLTHLITRNNNIRDEGAKALAAALRVNEVLTNLELMGNNVGDEGATALASALRVNGVLNKLNISSPGTRSAPPAPPRSPTPSRATRC